MLINWLLIFFIKVELSIPQTWKGNEVILKWKSQSEAMIYNDKGHPLQGLSTGISHQMRSDYTISKCWNGTDGNLIFFIEMACNNMFGAGHNGMISESLQM